MSRHHTFTFLPGTLTLNLLLVALICLNPSPHILAISVLMPMDLLARSNQFQIYLQIKDTQAQKAKIVSHYILMQFPSSLYMQVFPSISLSPMWSIRMSSFPLSLYVSLFFITYDVWMTFTYFYKWIYGGTLPCRL